MIALPPIPTWEGLHPLVVHFPIALLLVAPLLVLLGALLAPPRGRPWLFAALTLLVLGTAGTYLAVASGEATGELAERAPGVSPVLEQHEELAETTRAVFTGLTLALAAILFAPTLLRKPLAFAPNALLLALFLVAYAGGAVVLANTAHAGGRLVHELGVRAPVASTAGAVNAAADTSEAAEREHAERAD